MNKGYSCRCICDAVKLHLAAAGDEGVLTYDPNPEMEFETDDNR